MRKKIQLTAQIVFLIILIVPSLAWGMIRLVSPSAMEALDYDLGENREKNPFPESFNAGSYTEELEAYYTDRIPFRSVMITANKRFSGSLEKVYLTRIQPALASWIYRGGVPSGSGQDTEGMLADGGTSGDRDLSKFEEDWSEGEDFASGGGSAEGDSPGGGSVGDGPAKGDPPEDASMGNSSQGNNSQGGDSMGNHSQGNHSQENNSQGNNSLGGSPGETDQEEYIIEDESGHRYKRVKLVKATCTKDGEAVYECLDCGDSYTEELPAQGHTVEKVRTVEATFADYGYTEYRCTSCGSTYKDDIVVKQVEDTYLPATIVGESVLLGRCGWLYYTADDSISYYKGTNLLSNDKKKEYLSQMVRLQEICDRRGIRLQFMIMPNKDQVYPEYMPSYKVEQIEKRVDRFVDYVRKNSSVNIIYPLKELKTAKADWQTYYKYDTHWNNIGAFIGTQELYRALGMPVTELRELDIATENTKRGDLLILGGLDSSLYDYDTEYLVNYRPEVQVTSRGNADTIYYASSDSANQCNFVMLADSYRVMMLPYLERDFSKITVAHRDYVESIESSIKEADILVIAAVERYDNRIYKTIQTLIEMLGESEGE